LVAGLSRDLFVETDEIPRLWTLLQSKGTRLEGVVDATNPAALSQHEL
jgi:hypothetical protein